MVRVYLGLGSNVDREKHIRSGLLALQSRFCELLVSPIYESEAVGFEGDHFLNLVVGLDTDVSVAELHSAIKCIEDDHGRERGGPKFSPRTLDIDILTYGESHGCIGGVQLPREEILKYSFVLKPLVDLAGEELHPLLKKTYASLWQEFEGDKTALWVARPLNLEGI